MRIFTDKERTAIAKAFLRFMAYMDGRRATAKTYQKLTDRAIDSGLSLGVIFNPVNYANAAELYPEANAETYMGYHAHFVLLDLHHRLREKISTMV